MSEAVFSQLAMLVFLTGLIVWILADLSLFTICLGFLLVAAPLEKRNSLRNIIPKINPPI
jgi:hypothetical protein